ncbi:nucleotidyltransferase family protein [Natrinema versiforme]|uniref:nucleotidyltransferase family protein n=1 Tax=Natrinema versiforme TaxID=88724 RepID=UPI001EF9F68F|nr:nucleotidyltransferase family protein [Natrinema versiforme]
MNPAQDRSECTSLPVMSVVDPDRARERDSTIWGLLLAAGTSNRYGTENKLLEPIHGEPIIRHATRALVSSSVDGVTLVAGHQADDIRTAVAGFDVEIRVNDNYEKGQSTSVRTGIEAMCEHEADAAVIALGDMPCIASSTVDRLITAYVTENRPALAAAYRGQRGNPVLFDAQFFDALVDVTGDVGGRRLLLSVDDGAAVETADPGVLRDIDRPSDLRDLE